MEGGRRAGREDIEELDGGNGRGRDGGWKEGRKGIE